MLKHKKIIILILFLVGLLALFEISGLRQHFSLQYLRTVIQHHPVSGLFIFVGAFCLGNLVQVPGWIFLAAAVLALGQLVGGVVTYLAAMISCGVTFFIIRLIGGDALRKLNGKWALKLLGQLDAHPFTAIALLRTLMQTAPALNYALALSGVTFRKYIIGTAIGLPLPIALYCIFFDLLAKTLSIT